MNNKTGLRVSSAIILGMGASLSQAWAQAAAEEAVPQQQTAEPIGTDIIVTARRIDERLQDVPISITVFNQEQITSRNIVNAGDLATFTPSLAINPNYGTEYTSFAIRGFVQDPSTPPSVGVYFADVVAPRGPTQGTQAGDGAGPGMLFDLQNVQVLKGPQGTLFGRNTTGGAVLLVPRKPTGDLEGYLEGSIGNYNMVRVQGAVNVPIAETVRLRVAADHLNREGWLKNNSGIGPKDFNDVNYLALRASLVVDLAPDLENYTIVSYSRSNTNGSMKKLIACAPTLGFGAGFACPQLAREADSDFFTVQNAIPDPQSLVKSWQAINTTTWTPSDLLTIKNIVSYGELSAVQRTSLFGTDFRLGIPALGIPEQQITFSTITPIEGGKITDQWTLTEELQFQGRSSDDSLNWQAGAYLEISRPKRDYGTQGTFMLACTNIYDFACTDIAGIGASAATGFTRGITVGSSTLTMGRTRFKNIGLYGQATYSLSDQLKLTGGLRYTWDQASNENLRVSYTFPVLPPFDAPVIGSCTDNPAIAFTGTNCTSRVEAKSGRPTWLIGLDYKPSDDLLIYGKYTRGYRAGGVAPLSPINYRTFEPEKVDAFEAGVKATMRGAISGTLNFAGFYNDFFNQQIQAGFFPTPGARVGAAAGPVNAGQSRIWGAEVEAAINLFEGFRVEASYTYLNTELRKVVPIELTDPNYVVSFQINPGDPLPLSPRNKLALSAYYTLPLSEEVGDVRLGATFVHSGSQLATYLYRNNAPVRDAFGMGDFGTLKAFNLLNLSLDWRGIAGSPVDVSLFATNVTNEKYYTYVVGLGQGGFESANLGEPRMYGMRLRYNFGS